MKRCRNSAQVIEPAKPPDGALLMSATFESSHESAAERVFVRELNHGETTKIPDDHEYVLVNGINVEQVVLHLSHDLAERWQVTAQHRVLVHSPKFVNYSTWLLE